MNLDKYQWSTPDPFFILNRDVPARPGIYMFVTYDFDSSDGCPGLTHRIDYIGSSINLKRRFAEHEWGIQNELRKQREGVFFLFLECEDYKEREIELIKFHKPRLNVIHNPDWKNYKV